MSNYHFVSNNRHSLTWFGFVFSLSLSLLNFISQGCCFEPTCFLCVFFLLAIDLCFCLVASTISSPFPPILQFILSVFSFGLVFIKRRIRFFYMSMLVKCFDSHHHRSWSAKRNKKAYSNWILVSSPWDAVLVEHLSFSINSPRLNPFFSFLFPFLFFCSFLSLISVSFLLFLSRFLFLASSFLVSGREPSHPRTKQGSFFGGGRKEPGILQI